MTTHPPSRRLARAALALLACALALLACALALLACAAPAFALSGESYGELTRFGLGGPGEAPGTLNDEHRTRLLGVDPTDNSAYVLDEPREEQQVEREIKRGKPGCPVEEEEPEPCEFGEGPIIRFFRIQKFAAASGKYSPVASAIVGEQAPTGVAVAKKKPTPAEVEFAEAFEEEIGLGAAHGRALAVEGIAVDPGLGRVYVLATDLRMATLGVDRSAGEAPLFMPQVLPVASILYAFSTHAAGGALTPAVGSNPIIAGLAPQSQVPGQALLEPAGITVDPATHEVLVLAHVDESGAAQDNIESASDHFVVQRIHPDGTLGTRYVDSGNCLAKSASAELRPHSPIVVASGGAEHVYVGYQQGVVSIPCELNAEKRPKALFEPPQKTVLEEWIKAPQQAEGPQASPGPLVGGALSVSPEGTIFGAAAINLEEQGAYQAVLALSGADGSIIGWTGGQTQAAHPEGEGRYLCVIEPLFYNPFAPVAAGSGGDVFVLAPAFLFDRSINTAHEIFPYGPATPAVIELGPGGTGCPEAKSHEGLIARVKGEPVGEKSINSGESVNFSTHLLQADSLAVEWDFGDGSKETVSTLQLRDPEARHTYAHGGAMTVKAVIHTDDLATPTITLTTHVKVSEAAGTGPTALANGPLEAYVGQPALFDGSASFDPSGPNQVVAYHWDYGDGQKETTAEPVTFHTYSALGAYTASLTVTDKNGLTSTPYTLPQQVRVVPPPPPRSGGAGLEGAGVETPPSGRQGAGAGAGVASFHSSAGAIPAVTLAAASVRASKSGTVALALYCPASETTCAGTVTVRAALAVAGSKKHHAKTTRATIARGSFTLAGGTQKLVILRLSSGARALLARAPRLRAQVLIVAHDPAGATHTTQLALVVNAARKSGKH